MMISRKWSAAGLALCMAISLAGVGCGDDDSGVGNNNNNGNSDPVCGNGEQEQGEQCDDGATNSDSVPDACRTDCRTAWCGDGVIDASELCEGQDVGENTCAGLGLGFTSGDLACDAGCQLDTSACATCGNDLREEGESCDGLELGGATCASLTGLQEGIVSCDASCVHDTTDCHTCGDSVIQDGPEDCEDTDLSGATCESLGYTYGALACGTDCLYDAAECHGQCGNGVAQPDEECDGQDFAGQDCQSLGFVSGQLTCTTWCLRSVAQCHRCGNATMDAGEECDGSDLQGATCASISGGTMTGNLGCTSDCRLDATACLAPMTCGNALLEAGEQCDGANLGGATCTSQYPNLYGGGQLACAVSCLFDTSACTPITPCGNGMAEPAFGEQCDGQDLQSSTCSTLGFTGGTLSCDPTSCAFDTSACTAPLTCGNNLREATEACDGPDLGNATCVSLGFVSGTLACDPACAFDTTGCETCGDSVINGGDQCDGPDLGASTCATLGYYGGTLACQTDCTHDLTSCEAAGFCGDNIIHPAQSEQCDTTNFGTDTCTNHGFDGGVLTCTPSCQIDTSTCATCGNALCEVGEPGACPADCSLQPISAGESHTCAVKPNGTVWCWGYNQYGGLGDGTSTESHMPVQVVGPGGTGFLTAVVSVSAGKQYTCALKADGTVLCWGYGQFGQLGDGMASTTQNTPVQVLGPGGVGFLTDVVALSAGGYPSGSNYGHTCAVKSDGMLWCWGYNVSGQLGDSTTTQSNVPTQVVGPGGTGLLTDVATVASGGAHTCAVKTDGTVLCWGDGASGRLGHGGTWSSATPVEIVVLPDVATVSAGGEHTCATKTNGTLWCWGEGVNGQLGKGLTTDSYFPSEVLALNSVASVEAGIDHTCAVKTDGTTWCWGRNYWGQVGDSTWQNQSLPVQVLSGATHVSAGQNHSCAYLGTGGIRCWGENTAGQLGMGTSTLSPLPLAVTGGPSATAVDSGVSHSCAVASDTTAWCWGYNNHGRLGDGTSALRTTPVQVVGPGGAGALTTVAAISAGDAHTCAKLGDGSAWCWGSNSQGQLGDNTTTASSAPVQVVGPGGVGMITSVAVISAGIAHTCAVLSDGTTWCWGRNSYGQLGDSTTSQSSVPVQVVGPGGVGVLSSVAAISAGDYHTCAALDDGTAWCWGSNSLGQLGDNTTTTSGTPVQVLGPAGIGTLADMVTISAGQRHTCALQSIGTSWCWGAGGSGRLGNGTAQNSLTPVQAGLSSASSISAGFEHTCALVTGGASASCWGNNQLGQLGIGSTSSYSFLPVAVSSVSGLADISTGGNHTCAVETGGALWCWGTNASAQLGNPDWYHQPSPVDVVGFP